MATTIDIQTATSASAPLVSVDVIFDADLPENYTRTYYFSANDFALVADNVNVDSAMLHFGPYTLGLTNSYTTLSFNGGIVTNAYELALLTAGDVAQYTL